MRIKKILPIFIAMTLMLAFVGCVMAEAEEASSLVESAPVSSIPPESVPEAEPPEPPAITVRYLEGEVVYLRDGKEAPLTTDTLLHQGDEVKTRADGMAVLKLDGDKQVQVAPSSHLEVAGFERGDGADKTLLLLHAGNIINILDAPLEGDAGYEVETPSLVMAIRGTIASVSSDPETGADRVLLFEGHSEVESKNGDEEAEISAGDHAWVLDGQLEQGAFAGADLNPNEYWFLYEARHADFFDQPGVKIAKRLEPLLETQDYQDEALAAGAVGGSPTANAGAPQGAATSPSPSGGGNTGGTTAPAEEQTPAPTAPPAETPPADPDPPSGGGMDEATFRAIEQEFLKAKEDYNSGLISKDAFLAVKEKYIAAKKLYYGD